MYLMYI